MSSDDDPVPTTRRRIERGIALGFLAMLPLLLAYEAALARSPHGARNVGEILLSAPLLPFGTHATGVRWALLGALVIAALWSTFERDLGLLPRLWRVFMEGALAAIVLGPLLFALLHLGAADVDLSTLRAARPAAAPLARAALLAGGAAYEEIVFRVGLQSLLFVLARPLVVFLGAGPRLARRAADVLALVGAGLVFAAAHLAVFLDVLGPGGERYDASTFTWRASAGILLGCLFRWRGPGVAAWTHALFNLALFIGAGPDVFL